MDHSNLFLTVTMRDEGLLQVCWPEQKSGLGSSTFPLPAVSDLVGLSLMMGKQTYTTMAAAWGIIFRPPCPHTHTQTKPGFVDSTKKLISEQTRCEGKLNSLKKVKKANKYQVQISKSKKFNKVLVKKTVKKVKFVITSKKLKNKKKLFVRVRALQLVNRRVYTGKWSKIKKVKIK